MNVLVLGAAGNIGRALCPYLAQCGHTVYQADSKPGHAPDYYNLDIACSLDPVAHLHPDVVVLLAGMVSRVTCEQSPALAVRSNLLGLQNVLDYCRRHQARLVYASSSEVYGPHCEPMSEDAPLQPLNKYGLTKKLAEELIAYEVAEYGLRAVVLRLFMVYGPGEDRGAHRSALVRWADALAHGQPITVHRRTWRSWLHIADAVDAFERALHLRLPQTINVGHPHVQEMAKIARQLAALVDADPALLQEADCPHDITPRKVPDLRRMGQLLQLEPAVSLAAGLAELAAAGQTWA